MSDPRTLIGNVRISSVLETNKIDGHPWTYPYSGFGLGNSLRNAYAYSQYASQHILTYDWPVRLLMGGRGYQVEHGIYTMLDGTAKRVIRQTQFNFSPWTHLRLHFRYGVDGNKVETSGSVFYIGLTGSSVTEAVVLPFAVQAGENRARIIETLENGYPPRYQNHMLVEEHLIPISGNAQLTGSVIMNVNVRVAPTAFRIRPISLTLIGENYPNP